MTMPQDLLCSFGHFVSGQRDLHDKIKWPRRRFGGGATRGLGQALRTLEGDICFHFHVAPYCLVFVFNLCGGFSQVKEELLVEALTKRKTITVNDKLILPYSHSEVGPPFLEKFSDLASYLLSHPST